jgi:hypothetical protein
MWCGLTACTDYLPLKMLLPMFAHLWDTLPSARVWSVKIIRNRRANLCRTPIDPPSPTWKTSRYITSSSYPLTCLAWVALPGAYTSASIVLRVTRARRPPLHDKAVALVEDWPYYLWITSKEESRNLKAKPIHFVSVSPLTFEYILGPKLSVVSLVFIGWDGASTDFMKNLLWTISLLNTQLANETVQSPVS